MGKKDLILTRFFDSLSEENTSGSHVVSYLVYGSLDSNGAVQGGYSVIEVKWSEEQILYDGSDGIFTIMVKLLALMLEETKQVSKLKDASFYIQKLCKQR
jgi:hypothetical protein